jgi:hypothetical protein
MKKVFICSPYKSNRIHSVEQNVERAKELCKCAAQQNLAPFAPHLLYTQFLDDTLPESRTVGMDCGLAFLKMCNIMWVDSRFPPTEGMQIEINLAEKLQIPIVNIYLGECESQQG